MWPMRESLHTRARKSPTMQARVEYDSVDSRKHTAVRRKAVTLYQAVEVRKDICPEPVGEGLKGLAPDLQHANVLL